MPTVKLKGIFSLKYFNRFGKTLSTQHGQLDKEHSCSQHLTNLPVMHITGIIWSLDVSFNLEMSHTHKITAVESEYLA